jgi:hypothetical protein
MANRDTGRKVYRTMQGKEVELDKLIMRHETTLAVGNVKMNARGDELGPGGKIIRKREDIMTEYHTRHDAVPSQPTKRPQSVSSTEQSVPAEQPIQEVVQKSNMKSVKPVKNIDDQDPLGEE